MTNGEGAFNTNNTPSDGCLHLDRPREMSKLRCTGVMVLTQRSMAPVSDVMGPTFLASTSDVRPPKYPQTIIQAPSRNHSRSHCIPMQTRRYLAVCKTRLEKARMELWIILGPFICLLRQYSNQNYYNDRALWHFWDNNGSPQGLEFKGVLSTDQEPSSRRPNSEYHETLVPFFTPS